MTLFLAALLLFDVGPALAEAPLRLGVFAFRPHDVMVARYQPLADHLSKALGGRAVALHVLEQAEMETALAADRLDLVFTNPSHYMVLRSRNTLGGALATQISLEDGTPTAALGGVIVARAERDDLASLADLRGKRVAIPGPRYLGGFQTQAYELLKIGIDATSELALIETGRHDLVIEAVLAGRADAGFVRTGVIESLRREGKLAADALKLVNPRTHPRFPYLVSTDLYPEWAFLALPHVDNRTVRLVASALLGLKADDPAALAAGIEGFAPPADYLPVESLARALRAPPFDAPPRFTLADLWQQHRAWILLLGGFALALLLVSSTLVLRNRDLRAAKRGLETQSRRLNEVIWGTNVGTWEWNVQTGEVVFNARWAEICGYTLDALAPLSIATWERLVHPDDLAASSHALEKVFSGTLDTYSVELRMRHKDGGWVWIQDRGRVVEWTLDGKPLRMSGTHQDITERKEAEALLASHEERLRTIFDLLPVGVALTDRAGRIIERNATASRLLGSGLESDLGDALDATRWNVLRADGSTMPEAEFPWVQARASGREVRDVMMNLVQSGGSTWLSASAMPIEHPRYGQVIALVNITEKRLAEHGLELAASVFSHAREGIMITDVLGNIVDVNASFSRITGYAREEVLGRNPRFLKSGQQEPDFYTRMWKSLLNQGHWQGETWNRHKKGHLYAENINISAVRDGNGEIRNFVALFSDITTIKAHQQQLEQIAHYDALTGLPNRLLFAERLQQAIVRSQRRRDRLSVAYLDLDGFKQVNDQHGHDVGDQLLRVVAQRMRNALRESDIIARLGGDEFVIVLPELQSAEDCVPVLERILAAAATTVQVRDKALHVSASIGVAIFPEDGREGEQLVRQADQAMYAAKQAGRNRYRFIRPERCPDQGCAA